MKLMILGASKAQINAIKRAQKMGFRVVATDYNNNSIGKQIADEAGLASTFDYEETLKIAKEKNIDGVMTTGTDQPVYVVNKVAETLNLSAFLSVETAYNVTNKRAMKRQFTKHHIPTADYRIVNKNFVDEDLGGLEFPVVVKPLDSQGQRGIYKLNSIDEIRAHFDKVLDYSREEEILIESYYKNDEITVSGWVKNGKTKVLTITDRVTFEDDKYIGICLSHEFPSKHYKNFKDGLIRLTEDIVKVFKIKEGPIYFQFFIGDEGIKVNEIACRIGGAYEDEFIPLLTGVDILKMVIDGSLGKPIDYEAYDRYSIESNNKYLSSQLFFAYAGHIKSITDREDVKQLPGVFNVNYNYDAGQEIKEIENASQRAGYVIITGANQEELENNVFNVYKNMLMLDENNKNMIIHRHIGSKEL